MTTILLCSPDYYGIHYEINPWMNVNVGADHREAMLQWRALRDTLQSLNVELKTLTPIEGLPDLVFTANGGLWLGDNKIVLPHFKYPERQGEEPHFKRWFEENGFECVNKVSNNSPYFEGAGDALFAGDLLFAGYGFRSDKAFFNTAAYLDQQKIILCELIDPYFYHIDTCFCPLNDSLALWYPDAFSADAKANMQKEIELIEVSVNEAKQFACNAVVVDKHVILPTGTPQLCDTLKRHGFIPHPLPMHEYIKAGGACKCLTLLLGE